MSQNRLALIRSRAKQNLSLSPVAASLLEELRKEDSDLGGLVAVGEILAPPSITIDRVQNDDENEADLSLTSPAMRAALDA